jgi:hypothetical protein
VRALPVDEASEQLQHSFRALLRLHAGRAHRPFWEKVLYTPIRTNGFYSRRFSAFPYSQFGIIELPTELRVLTEPKETVPDDGYELGYCDLCGHVFYSWSWDPQQSRCEDHENQLVLGEDDFQLIFEKAGVPPPVFDLTWRTSDWHRWNQNMREVWRSYQL